MFGLGLGQVSMGSSGGGGSTPVNSSQPYKTGAATLGSFQTGDDADTNRGAGSDFFTLPYTNPFGNTDRFVDLVGGQTYTDGVVLNMATRNPITGLTLAMSKSPAATNTNQTNALSGQPYTLASKSDWMLPNRAEGEQFVYSGTNRNPFNYAPFNHNMSTSLDYVWGCYKDTTGGGYLWQPTQYGVAASTGQRTVFVVRYYTDAELGI